jgi:1-pyrroline-5-carboxylate dehydrogenase
MSPFKTEFPYDFSKSEHSDMQKSALAELKYQFGKEYANNIAGNEITTEKKTNSYSPANKNILIGTFQKSGALDAENAIVAAEKAFQTWKNVPAIERAEYFLRASEIIKSRRYEINAWMISESGKNYLEADADTCEAIDFLEFYSREAIRYSENQDLTGMVGEKNEYFYIPLGVGVVIPPWNFPFAIMAGMTTAAIVSGNTVVLKPSSETPMMARLFFDIMSEVGLPKGVFNYLVASGSEAGDYLVDHAKTRFISFTGSMEVGKRIYQRAGVTNPGQIWLKRVVAEMGGKDAMIIDSEWKDLEFAADQVVAASFGFQGQKCSACSRVIIDEKIYDELVPMIVERAEALTIGDPADDKNVGPVVNEAALNSIVDFIETGKKEGDLLLGGNRAGGNGWFIEPTIIACANENDTLAKEEVFGPVLAIVKSRDFDHSVEIFNSTIYGLTGSLMTDNKEKLERGRNELHCGNLYLNRKCTGAFVDVHPFGGFNMSGTCSKAGSRDYLGLFMQGKAVATKL